MPFSRLSFLGMPLDTKANTADIIGMIQGSSEARLVDFVGPIAWRIAREQPAYLEKINQMALIVPDGHGLALACRLIARKDCRSLTFDMTGAARGFFKKLAEDKTPLAIVGGKPHDDEDAREKLSHRFPDLNIAVSAHGYGDFAPKIASVLAARPQVVLVSMAAPRQEEFLIALRDAGFKGLAIGCGAFMERYASDKFDDYHLYPAWVDEYRVMPLYKLYREPQRLWQRYVFEYKYFITLAIKELVQQLTSKSEGLIQQVTQK